MRTGVLAAVLGLLLLGLVVLLAIGSPAPRGRPSAETADGTTRPAAAPAKASEVTPAPAPAEAIERTAMAPEDEEVAGEVADEKEPEVWPTVRVLVLDAARRPVAGAGVRLFLEIGGSSFDLPQETGADGLATFVDVGKHLPVPLAGAVTRARLAGTFRTPVASEPWSAAWPSEPVVLVMPPAGSCVVEVRDSAGRPLTPRAAVSLETEGVHEAGTHMWNAAAARRSEPVEGGEARFAPIELGLTLRARLVARADHGRGETVFPGPTVAGQEVRAVLVPEAAPPAVVVRFVSPDGRPLADAEVECSWSRRVEGASLSSGGTPRRADAAGRLRIPIDEPWREGSTVELVARHAPTTIESWTGTLDLSRAFPPGETDIGDLRLLPEELLVSGRVVDGDGQPVSAFWAKPEANPDGSGQQWTLPVGARRGAADGTFAFHGQVAFPAMRLRIEPDEYATPDPVPFTPGTSGLEIVVRRGGGLEGSLRPVPSVRFDDVYVIARNELGDPVGDGTIHGDGSFEITGLPTGTFSVVFGSRPIEGDLLAIPGVAAVRGQQERDARLLDVDLSSTLRGLRIAVREADGRPAASGWVRPLDRGMDDPIAFVVEEGVARVLTRPEPLDLEVNAPGHRIVRLTAVSADEEVTLEPAFEVTLRVPDTLELPPEGTRLEVALTLLSAGTPRPNSIALLRGGRQAGWWSGTFRSGGNAFAEERSVRFSVQEFGRFGVLFYLIQGTPGGGQIAFGVQATDDLRIGAGAAGQTFVVEPDPEGYAERLGR